VLIATEQREVEGAALEREITDNAIPNQKNGPAIE
jgi:hypothetical protein